MLWCAELILNPVVRWHVKRRSATHPNLDALTRGLKPHGYLQETAPRSFKTSKLQSRPEACATVNLSLTLRFLAHGVINEHQGGHRLDHRDRARKHTWIMPAAARQG